MTTTMFLAIGTILFLALVGLWLVVTWRSIHRAHDRALRAHLDWRPKQARAAKATSLLRH